MHFFLASTALLTLLKSRSALGLAVQPSVKDVTLDIVNTNLAPDGFSRSVVTANGTYPGPPITAVKGQTLRVKVNNKLTDATMRRSTSINFDGVFVSTPDVYDEGSPFVTTCPIAPASSYTYELPLGDQTGTFWYHSQLSVQYVDGLRGPLIIYGPLAHLYDVDDLSTIIQIELYLPLLAGYEATGVVPVSDSGTVNGAGRFNGGPEVAWSVVNVVAGKRYRLRIINESARNVFTMSIDSHTLTVIEADGVATQPSTVDTLDLLPDNATQCENATLSRAILRYAGAPRPTRLPNDLRPVNGTAMIEADLRPLVPTPVLVPDVNITLDLEVVRNITALLSGLVTLIARHLDCRKAIWTVNNISYLHPTVPTLNKILAGPVNASSFDPTENTFILPAHKTIQITFPPTDDDDAHPLHLHGVRDSIATNDSPLTSRLAEQLPGDQSMTAPDINIVNPISRDVVGVGGSGTTIRFRTDNAGPGTSIATSSGTCRPVSRQ
ncbi:Cupredoxin [Infundibulicybe gibba]|nr:Cupredoxin [Infundibulicybe gibba]